MLVWPSSSSGPSARCLGRPEGRHDCDGHCCQCGYLSRGDRWQCRRLCASGGALVARLCLRDRRRYCEHDCDTNQRMYEFQGSLMTPGARALGGRASAQPVEIVDEGVRGSRRSLRKPLRRRRDPEGLQRYSHRPHLTVVGSIYSHRHAAHVQQEAQQQVKEEVTKS